MRTLDKYLLREFLWPVLCCFDAFLMLIVVIDLFDALPDLLQYRATAGQALRYYIILLPEMIVYALPMSLLLGLLFCLSNLGKHNELIAMRASGVSLARIAAPMLAVGAVASAAMFGVNEWFGANAKSRANAFLDALGGKAKPHVLENFFYTNPSQQRDWYARRFNTQTHEMLDLVQFYQRRRDGAELRIDAESARWHGGQWHFHNARVNAGAAVAHTNFPAITDSPGHMALEAKRPSEMSLKDLRRYLRAQKRAGNTEGLAPYRVWLHYRYAFPLTCLMVIWIGLPLGLQVSRAGPLLGVGTALALVGAFYFLSQLTVALGKGGHIPPVVAAWLTDVVFGVVGAWLLWRTR